MDAEAKAVFASILDRVAQADRRRGEPVSPIDEETAEMRAEAWEVLNREAESASIPISAGGTKWVTAEVGTTWAIEEANLPALQAEWRRNPALRCCIRLVADIDPEKRDASLLLRALWEMSLSHQWRREAGGMLPFEWPPM